MLPAHIKSLLGLAADSSPELQQAAVDAIAPGWLGFLHSENSKTRLLECIAADNFQKTVTKFLLPGFADNWHFQQIELTAGSPIAVVYVPENPAAAPPQLVEDFLLTAWLNEASLIVETEPGSYALNKQAGYILSAVGTSPLHLNLAKKISGFESEKSKFSASGIRRFSQFNIGADSLLLKASASLVPQLFEAALQRQDYKWRYVGLYRIFEAVYLHTVLEKINNGFLREPTETIQDALKSIESELSTFRDLVTHNQLESFFDRFAQEIDALCAAQNRFACAVRHRVGKATAKEFLTAGQAVKGVAYAYKVRCSIVHSGAKDIVFDSYPDGDDALEKLLPIIEEAALELIDVHPS